MVVINVYNIGLKRYSTGDRWVVLFFLLRFILFDWLFLLINLEVLYQFWSTHLLSIFSLLIFAGRLVERDRIVIWNRNKTVAKHVWIHRGIETLPLIIVRIVIVSGLLGSSAIAAASKKIREQVLHVVSERRHLFVFAVHRALSDRLLTEAWGMIDATSRVCVGSHATLSAFYRSIVITGAILLLNFLWLRNWFDTFESALKLLWESTGGSKQHTTLWVSNIGLDGSRTTRSKNDRSILLVAHRVTQNHLVDNHSRSLLLLITTLRESTLANCTVNADARAA